MIEKMSPVCTNLGIQKLTTDENEDQFAIAYFGPPTANKNKLS